MLKRVRPQLPDGCVSDLSFDGMRARELSRTAQQKIADHVSNCDRCRARQRELDRDFAQVEAQLPPFVPSPSTQPKSKGATPGHARPAVRRAALLSAVALAACALLGLLPWVVQKGEMDVDTRTKGGPGLSFYIKRGDAVFAWTPGEPVTAGDVLRFVVRPRGYGQVAILSRGDDGETSVYYPEGAHSAAVDAQAAAIPLDSAVELDGALRDERLFALFCRAPFATDVLAAELAASGTLSAPAGCAVATLLLPKRLAP